MTTATGHVKSARESARETQRKLPHLDTARAPLGLEAIEPFTDLMNERKRLFNEALHARSAAERADREVLKARALDEQAFEEAATQGEKDPGRVNELASINMADEAHRIAVGRTRAANTATRKIRSAIDGKLGDEAMAISNEHLDADLDRLHKSAQVLLADLGIAIARKALIDSIADTRKSDYATIRVRPPTLPGAERALRELLDFDPRRDG